MTNEQLLLIIVVLQTTYLTVKSAIPNGLSRRGKIVCDTSALIDGRIVAIARSGFVSDILVVPHSVVRELQYMADKADHDKRERARYGLDVIQQLQQLPGVSVNIYNDGSTDPRGVDEQLIVIAKKLSAKLCTTDYNLNKVARTESITVVNVNELAHALRPMHLPGETIQVHIVAPGQNRDQGVGYLDDGSMVVVDGGRAMLGKDATVEATRVLQTEAGRMVFARIVKRNTAPKSISTTATKQSRHQRAQSKEDTVIDLANR